MKKNIYIQPQSEVMNIEFCSIVCGSPTPSSNPDLHFGGTGNYEIV